MDFLKIIYDYLCAASESQAGDCQIYASREVVQGAKKNLFIDMFKQTAQWNERGIIYSYF